MLKLLACAAPACPTVPLSSVRTSCRPSKRTLNVPQTRLSGSTCRSPVTVMRKTSGQRDFRGLSAGGAQALLLLAVGLATRAVSHHPPPTPITGIHHFLNCFCSLRNSVYVINGGGHHGRRLHPAVSVEKKKSEERHERLFLHQISWDNSGSTVTVRLAHPPRNLLQTCTLFS